MSDVFTDEHVPAQDGRVVVITGGNSGLGLNTAKVLAARGARVVVACRNKQKAEDALAQIRAAAGEG
ncbi:MAG TPA: SDR family NAD(P)-dependent oxidoreductase, partial [Polyangiaceae bacterium]